MSLVLTKPEQDAKTAFDEHTAKHVLEVLHDEGVYRHLRFAAPGTNMYSYSLVTWPGHMAMTGDLVSGYIFQRSFDMFKVFEDTGHSGINPIYWSEKIVNHESRRSVQHFRGPTEEDPDGERYDWDFVFLMCCWAIRKGIGVYRRHKGEESPFL